CVCGRGCSRSWARRHRPRCYARLRCRWWHIWRRLRWCQRSWTNAEPGIELRDQWAVDRRCHLFVVAHDADIAGVILLDLLHIGELGAENNAGALLLVQAQRLRTDRRLSGQVCERFEPRAFILERR